MNAWAWPYTQSMLPVHTCLSSSCTAPCGAHDLAQLVTHTFAVGPYAEVGGWGYAIADCDDACDDQDLPGLMSFVQTHGPASICVNAERWFDYTGGVLSSGACGGHASGDLDHCVQVVGYNSSAADPYWIVRNQWDTVRANRALCRVANSIGSARWSDRPFLIVWSLRSPFSKVWVPLADPFVERV